VSARENYAEALRGQEAVRRWMEKGHGRRPLRRSDGAVVDGGGYRISEHVGSDGEALLQEASRRAYAAFADQVQRAMLEVHLPAIVAERRAAAIKEAQDFLADLLTPKREQGVQP